MIKIAVVGASGYTGAEMLRLLQGHPELVLSGCFGARSAGETLAEHYPHLDRAAAWRIEPIEVGRIADAADWAVLGLPHGTSAELAAKLLDAGLGVLDLSASFRLDQACYEAHYGQHPCPERIGDAVYGLPELARPELPGVRLIAGPGCFPTAVTLACAPFVALLGESPIIADCKTGVTGAGASASATTHFPAVAETVTPYKVESHRHGPEILRNLTRVAGRPLRLRFTPHLLPIRRGILATCYLPLRPGVGGDDLVAALHDFCRDEPFVHALRRGVQPSLARVAGTNEVELQVVFDPDNDLAVVTCAIDNLCKGSSGGALQALNVALGLPETLGLSSLRPAVP